MTDPRPLKRLRSKTTVECLWPYILSLMRQEPAYAYEIRGIINDRYGFSVGQVTAYMVLYKLEKQGYVKAKWRQVNNRQRKYYQITGRGTKALEASIDILKNTAKQLEE